MRLHRRLTALAFALSLLVGNACGSGADDSAERVTTTVGAAPTTDATQVGQVGAQVVLDDPGSAPRRVLLLRVPPGTRTRVAVENRIGIELTIDGEEAPATEAPASTTVLDHRVDRVDPDGTVHFSVTVAEVSVDAPSGADPEIVRSSQETLNELVGLQGTGSVDSHGAGQTLEFDTSALTDSTLAETLDSVADQLGSLSAPFPIEPVGIGARWTVRSTATVSGITMNTTTRYTLRILAGDHYELDYSQDGDAPPGPASLPGMPAGARASIESFVMQSEGQTVGDLTSHLPASNEFSGTGDATMTLTVAREKVTLVQHLTIGSNLSAT